MPTVFPSASKVPANLLRISLVFTVPPSGSTLRNLHLTHADGATIHGAFYPQPLWSPDGRVLTVYLNPGRVKTGLIAHDTLGWALKPDGDVQLRLRQQVLKTWHVASPNELALDPSRWVVHPPAANTRQPLRVSLDLPIDSRDTSLIAVQAPDGSRVAGVATLAHGETAWRLQPRKPWTQGDYVLRLHPDLEDPEGNRVGQAFEHAAMAPTNRVTRPATIPFRIR